MSGQQLTATRQVNSNASLTQIEQGTAEQGIANTWPPSTIDQQHKPPHASHHIAVVQVAKLMLLRTYLQGCQTQALHRAGLTCSDTI